MKKIVYIIALIGIMSLFFASCAKKDSDSSSSSSASTSTSSDADETVAAAPGSSALTLSSKMSLVSANGDASASSRTAFSHFSTDNFTSGEDITVDATETFVYERSADAFETANSILCWIGQTRAGQMIGQGNYKAQIDKTQCQELGEGNSNAPQYEMWTVNSSRADGEPMIVSAWIPGENNVIYAQSKVYQSPSDEHPWGHFKMSFSKRQGTTISGTELFKGYLRTKKKKDGSNVLQFYMPKIESDGTTSLSSVSVRKKSGSGGTAITTMPKYDQTRVPTGEQKSYKIAFNKKYFYKQKTVDSTPSDPICLRRDKYIQSAYRYGLYHDNGSRLNINSGFPIKATASGTNYYGYIGYYGLWMPPQANVDNGSTVAKMDFGGAADQTGTNYTVRSWPGKLIKYTKNNITLGSIKNVPLDVFDTGGQKRVAWNGTNFILEATNVQGVWVDNASSILTLNTTNAWNGLNFYSQALGGDGIVELTYSNGFGQAPDAPADNATVIFNTQSPVFPGDSVPANLACYRDCLDTANLASGTKERGSIYKAYKSGWFYSQNIDNASSPTPHMYTFDNTTNGMVLKDNGTSVILTTTNSNIPYGTRTGPLFDNTTSNFNLLKCSWDANKICPWNVRGKMTTFYQWETGPQSWNKTEILMAADNSSVRFDPPMSVKYTHSGTSSNSSKSYDNSSFYLEYGGFGNLWGLPSFCIDRKDGEKVSCTNDGSTRYIEDLLVPAYADVTQTADGTTNYIVKPLNIEQTMKKASSASKCTVDARLAFGDISLPDESGYTAPDMTAMPTVEGPPAVVGGVKM